MFSFLPHIFPLQIVLAASLKLCVVGPKRRLVILLAAGEGEEEEGERLTFQ